jgi:2-amino-4-hydroxy-6-hydroxymethyldihydropteridine diphosphokinase
LRAVVGLGANLGDRLGSLRAAVAGIREVATVERVSRVYATAPVGPPQPDYLNGALVCTYDGTPEQLLDALLAIERRLGRVRGEKWGPRTIDLDVLWIEGQVHASDRLVVPHAHLRERAFALVPLLEVAPGAIDPSTGQPFEVPAGDLRVTAERLD